jgi:hypothetical protein
MQSVGFLSFTQWRTFPALIDQMPWSVLAKREISQIINKNGKNFINLQNQTEEKMNFSLIWMIIVHQKLKDYINALLCTRSDAFEFKTVVQQQCLLLNSKMQFDTQHTHT